MFGKVKKLIASVMAVTMLITLAPSQLVTVMADTHFSGIEHSDNIVLPQAAPGGGHVEKQYAGTYNKKVNEVFEIESDHDGKNWYVANNDPNVTILSSDDDDLEIKCSAAGSYEISHVYKKKGQEKTEWFLVNITGNNSGTEKKTTLYVYMYGKDNQIKGTLNSSGWYTIGKVEVDGTVNTTNDWKAMNDTIHGYLKNIERWEPNKHISLKNIEQYHLHLVNSGADDYVKNEPAFHLDLKPSNDVKISDVTINYVDANGKTIAESVTTTGTVGNKIDLSGYAKNIDGYTFNVNATTKKLSTYPEYTIADGANTVNLVYDKNVIPVKTVKVAVYATDGSQTGRNAKLESSLVISHKQEDGYYPIGVIEVPETLVSGNSPYIDSPEDWETIKAAIKEISTAELTDSGVANAGNKIYENLDKVQVDLGYGAGTWRTAMFDWNGTSKNILGDYKYHLDLRFATNLLTVIGVREQNNGKFVADSTYLVQIPYLSGENTTEPKINEEGYEVEGYYSDSTLETKYTFGTSITSNQTVYVKLKKIEATYTINYYLNNTDNTVTVKNSFTKSAKYGDVITLSTADKTNSGYTFKSADKESLTIGKDSNVINVYFYKNVTLTANSNTTYVYDKTEKTVEGFTVSGELDGYASDFAGKVTAKRTETNAGTYDVTFISGGVNTVDNTGKYIVTGVTEGTLKIAKANATVTVTSASKMYGQDDPEFTGVISGVYKGDSLGEISYLRTNKTVNKVGKYENVLTATVPENKNYNVKVVNGDFEIVKAGTMTVSGTDVNVPYDGEVHGAAATSNITNGTTIYYSTDSGTTWREEYPTLTNVGKYTVNVKAVNDNYSDATATYTIEVTKKPVTITVADQSKKYGETDPDNSYTLSNALINSNDLGTITYARVSGENVGTYAINALYTPNANYDVTVKKGTLTINKATSLTVAPTLSAENRTKVYDGSSLEGEATASGAINGDTIKISYSVDGETWSTTVPSITNVAESGFIKAKAENSNYETATTEYSLTITPATTTITANGYTGTYDGDAHVGTITPAVTTGTTLTYAIVTNEVVGEYTSTVPKRTVVGTTTVRVKAVNSNYEDAYADYSITVNARPVEISAVAAEKIYGASDPTFTYDITSEIKLVNDGDLGTISVSRSNFKVNDAGFYDDVLVVSYTKTNDNYAVTTVPADFTIKKASGMTLTVNGYEGTYDGQAHSGTAVSDKEGSTIEYSTDNGATWSETVPTVTNVTDSIETVQVRATNNNYETVEKSYTLKVNPKAVTIKVDNANKVYGTDDPAFTGDVNGLVDDNDLGTITYYRENATTDTAVKTYTGVLKASYTPNSNYSVTVTPGNFEITASDELKLTVTNYSYVYDGESHGPKAKANITTGTKVEYSLGNDEWSETVPTVTNVTNGKVTVQVRATNSNYITATASYTLEVTPAAVTVTADNKSKVYGSKDPDFTASVSGLVAGEEASLISYTFTRESGEDVDKTYTITPSGSELQGNYKVTFAIGKLTITPQSIGPESDTNVKAQNPTNVVYNGTEQRQKVVVTDGVKTLVEGTDYELRYSADTTNVGTVTVTVTGKGNYTGSKTVTYQITQKPVIVTADDKAKIFGEVDPELTYSVDGTIGTDSVVVAIARTPGEAVVVGGYPITVSGEESQGNYKVSYVDGIFTINPKTIVDPDPQNPGEYPDDYEGIKVGTIDDVVYAGEPQELAPSVPGLVKDTDYTITYSGDTTNAGTVTVTITGIGNYTGTVTRTYNINKRIVTLTSASAGKVSDGTALTAQSVTVGGQGFAKNEGEGVTYIFSAAQTGIGSVANVFDYTLNTAVINPDNYVITKIYGTLTVAPVPTTEPDEPTPVTVTHTLTIHYVDAAGNAVAPDYVGTFVTGSSYLVASPVVLGYTPQFASVASPEGGMPDMDVEVSVLYTPNVPVVPQGNETPDVTTNVPDNGGAGDVPNDAGVQAVDENANVNDANTEIPDADVPQGALSVDENGNVEIVEIEDEETALAANTAKAWALINLLAMIATAVLGIVLLVLALKKKKEEKEDENAVKAESEENEDEAKEKNKKVLKLCGLIPAIASVIVFFLTENMKNPMAYVDKWTVLMVILLVVEIVLAVLSKKKKEEKEDNTQAPQEA